MSVYLWAPECIFAFGVFDVINHKTLRHKLQNMANHWFSCYLSNSTQFVEIDGQISSHKQIMTGVPQGSILGPLPYLLYVNDYHKSCESSILSFADDTN